MRFALASTEELYREHRRTQSRRKKERIADELQRRHDELHCRPGKGLKWWMPTVILVTGFYATRAEVRLYEIRRFDFRVMLP